MRSLKEWVGLIIFLVGFVCLMPVLVIIGISTRLFGDAPFEGDDSFTWLKDE